MNIVILGPQGSGKGTQAKKLGIYLKIPHVDAGKLLREKIMTGSEIGQKIKMVIEKGGLISDKIMSKIIKERLIQTDCDGGFVLDGFPRDLKEAEFLDELWEVDKVIFLEVSDGVAVARLSNRWQCEKCNEIYGVDVEPKKKGLCDVCGGKLFQRADDTPKAIKKRLAVFHDETEHLAEYYKPRNVLVRVDASKSIDAVFELVLNSLE